MAKEKKSVLISTELHKQLKETSEKSGIKIIHLTETAIRAFLNQIKVEEGRK